MKQKQQADGWPAWAKTEAQKEQYLREYLDKERIQLDPAIIEKNAGQRSKSKLCLNSFWGKVRLSF